MATSMAQRLRGLFGRGGFEGVLVLCPCNDIHTFGMRKAIDVAFVAEDGTVLESYKEVRPCRRLRCPSARATLERFSREGSWFEEGERVDVQSCCFS